MCEAYLLAFIKSTLVRAAISPNHGQKIAKVPQLEGLRQEQPGRVRGGARRRGAIALGRLFRLLIESGRPAFEILSER
uniref:Uncharacterized protein n=1 Tax=Lymantria dispar multicapsid nuclear polyhedrosis virus TaxID=10449 RepID=A0A140HR82_NPVLD|nr:hypothetical protein [Lymantria dispar multiple nucleopolyhedrovirus]